MRTLLVLATLASLLLTAARADARPTYAVVSTHVGFGQLYALAVDTEGNVYAADQYQREIVELGPQGKLMQRFRLPEKCAAISSVAVASSGAVYAVSICSGWVYVFTASGRILERFGGSTPAHGKPASGPGLPQAVAIGPDGQVYASFCKNHASGSVEELTPTGVELRTVARFAHDCPFQLTLDAHRNIYVSGETESGLYVVSPAGKITGRWGTTGSPLAQISGTGQPALDPDGYLYLTDAGTGFGVVMKFSPQGRFVGNVVRHGYRTGEIQTPCGLAIDGRGHLFVSQQSPDEIDEFSLTGKLLAIWKP